MAGVDRHRGEAALYSSSRGLHAVPVGLPLSREDGPLYMYVARGAKIEQSVTVKSLALIGIVTHRQALTKGLRRHCARCVAARYLL